MLVVAAGMVLAVGSLADGQAISPKSAEMLSKWGDQGDGTYINPILPGGL
jgi:hypothetical protein